MSLLSSLLLLILSARLIGETLKRFGQPALLGEILAGVLLGPSVFNLVHATPALSEVSDLAMFLIVLSAGLEMEFKDVVRSFRGAGLIVALMGFIIPLICGIAVGIFFHLDHMRTVFLGLCISITALPVAVGILKSFDMLHHPIGRFSIVTAVVNDVLALFALGIILNMHTVKSFSQLSLLIGIGVTKFVALAMMIVAINFGLEKAQARGLPVTWVPERLVEIFGKEALLGILILFVLLIGTVSEMLGAHFVVGAFFGALLIDRKLFLTSRFAELEQSLSSITSGFLAPIFFVYLGLESNVHVLPGVWLVITVVLVSAGSKILAGWMAGKWVGLEGRIPLGIGILLNGRGVMELIVANIAYRRGFIGDGLFSLLVVMGILTTFVTPLLFRYFVSGHLPDHSAEISHSSV